MIWYILGGFLAFLGVVIGTIFAMAGKMSDASRDDYLSGNKDRD